MTTQKHPLTRALKRPLTVAAAATTAASLTFAAAPASAQSADGEMLLATIENCMAWAQQGFPPETPFENGFVVETPLSPGGTGTYGVAGTGTSIEVLRNGEIFECRTVGAGFAADDGIRDAAIERFESRADAGRTHRIREARFALCDDPRGIAQIEDVPSGGVGVTFRWGDMMLEGEMRACDG